MKSVNRWFMIVSVAALGVSTTRATVLDFWQQGNYATTDAAGYGDKVTNTTSGGFVYEAGYGFTPNVLLSVDTPTWVYGGSAVWMTGNPGENVLGLWFPGSTNALTFSIEVPGGPQTVSLHSFWAGVEIDDGDPNRPSYGFSTLAAYVDGTLAWSATAADRTNFPNAGRFFQEGVTAGWTTGLLTATNNIRFEWVPQGGSTFAVKTVLTDIGFSSVPEPSSLLLLGVGGVLIAWFRRRSGS